MSDGKEPIPEKEKKPFSVFFLFFFFSLMESFPGKAQTPTPGADGGWQIDGFVCGGRAQSHTAQCQAFPLHGQGFAMQNEVDEPSQDQRFYFYLSHLKSTEAARCVLAGALMTGGVALIHASAVERGWGRPYGVWPRSAWPHTLNPAVAGGRVRSGREKPNYGVYYCHYISALYY